MATEVVHHEPEPVSFEVPNSASLFLGRLVTLFIAAIALWWTFGGVTDTGVLSRVIFLPMVAAFSMAVLTREDVIGHRITALFYSLVVMALCLAMWMGVGGVTKYADPYNSELQLLNPTSGTMETHPSPAATLLTPTDQLTSAEAGVLAPNTLWKYELNLPWWAITNPPNPTGEDYTTILDAKYHVGVDGWSFPLVVLSGVIFAIAVLASFGIGERTKEYFAWLMVLETAVMGTFCALNYILFYIFWEMMLVPMYFLIAIWGGPRREYAAIKMFLYTLFGSIFLLVGVLYLYFNTGGGLNTFEFNTVQNAVLAKHGELNPVHLRLVWLGIFLSFAIKVPIFPFHTWLPDAHVEAPTPASVILAAILLKMGTYGFFRVLLPTFPEETRYFTWLLAILGTIGIVYGALVAMAQDDLKKLVAYSSVGHMGFCILGFASMNELGISGANFMVLGHGIISAAMFLLVGVIYDRAHTRQIDAFGGLMHTMRRYAWLMYIAGFANLGLPGLVGFWGEILSLLGAFQGYYAWGAFNLMRVCACIAVLGMLTTAAYMLWMIQRMFLGKANPRWAGLPDVSVREQFTLWPLAAGMLIFGVFPSFLMNLYNGSLTILTNWMSNYAAIITAMQLT